MRTPWGDIPVADAHVHFFSDRFFRTLAQQKGDPDLDIPRLLGWETPDPDPASFAGRWVAELDRHGVQHAVMMASVPGDESSVAAAVAKYPDRFFGYFFCDPTRENAVDALNAALGRGLQGVCLFPAMHRYSISEPRSLAVIESVARSQRSVVFVHSGVLSVGVRKKLGLRSHFDMRFSNPIDLHSVALAYPNLPFVVPHFGAGYLREALMLADLCPNVYLDTSSTNSWIKYLLPEISLTDVFRRALDVVGPRRLLFGTDSSFFPRGWNRAVFDSQCKILHSIGVDHEQAAGILGGTLVKLLRAG